MTATQKNILVVDDEPSVRESLQRALVVHSFGVATAANGEEAVQKFSGASSDLVLLDWNIANENGWEIFQRLTAINPLLPVIVITASPDQISPSMRAAVDSVLEKPLDLPFLLSAIELLLSETRERRISRIGDVANRSGEQESETSINLTEILTRPLARNCRSASFESQLLSATSGSTNVTN